MFLKDYVSVIHFSNTMQCEKSTEAIESCGEKCANLYRVYKLIMVSRVPDYGHLEYLELDIIVDLITLFNEFIGLLITWEFWIELEEPSQ